MTKVGVSLLGVMDSVHRRRRSKKAGGKERSLAKRGRRDDPAENGGASRTKTKPSWLETTHPITCFSPPYASCPELSTTAADRRPSRALIKPGPATASRRRRDGLKPQLTEALGERTNGRRRTVRTRWLNHNSTCAVGAADLRDKAGSESRRD